ncbi:heme-binding domain-containing protein [Olleya marilimosa]|uniref:Heme-binding domain-containing protein n=1 Tax=Olleya marilimosa TaxID=272164 RepID=A0ABR8LQ59_9FLAO|nr:heme-binding domain-containing protein [Olleya marilimosa]MBD3862363.1 heme-binding domain-containing protein [Olleya marilimosa]MBD3889861.1 heme-binding domain-containing protein [Olleya marilimosa]PIB32278.1 cytochrome C [Gaetbulibacter sp. 5U11]|tara:strand:- start:46561 stop:47034 length:474 start_codon:yes stop_codon:yes gene_type:complete
MKLLKKIGLVLLLVFIVAQFFSPEKNQGNTEDLTAFLNETKPSPEVKTILETTCFDCHSSNTKYPWYDKITPINFWLNEHVEDGKKHLDFSKWSDYSIKRKDHKFEEIAEEVEEKKMPLPSYTWTHGDANLSDAQIKAVVDWVNQVRMGYALAPKAE